MNVGNTTPSNYAPRAGASNLVQAASSSTPGNAAVPKTSSAAFAAFLKTSQSTPPAQTTFNATPLASSSARQDTTNRLASSNLNTVPPSALPKENELVINVREIGSIIRSNEEIDWKCFYEVSEGKKTATQISSPADLSKEGSEYVIFDKNELIIRASQQIHPNFQLIDRHGNELPMTGIKITRISDEEFDGFVKTTIEKHQNPTEKKQESKTVVDSKDVGDLQQPKEYKQKPKDDLLEKMIQNQEKRKEEQFTLKKLEENRILDEISARKKDLKKPRSENQ